jgi:uncharacterized protein (DUF1778 family)
MNRRASLHVSIRTSAAQRQLLRYVASIQRKSLRQFLVESALRSAAEIVVARPRSGVVARNLSDGNR